jgi:hypothetical protein
MLCGWCYSNWNIVASLALDMNAKIELRSSAIDSVFCAHDNPAMIMITTTASYFEHAGEK